jgi:hypothetical protein
MIDQIQKIDVLTAAEMSDPRRVERDECRQEQRTGHRRQA